MLRDFFRLLAKLLEDQPVKRKTGYDCFCIMWRKPLQWELFWELQLVEPGTRPSLTRCNELIFCRLGREWHALSAEQKQAYQPASECAKADPHVAGQVDIEGERPKPEKRKRVWHHSCKAGAGGEGARARLEVKFEQPSDTPPAIVQTASARTTAPPGKKQTASDRTTAPPGKKWNARARKWDAV